MSRKRFALAPRLALAAAITLAIAIPAKIAVEPEIALASGRPVPRPAAPIEVANVDRAPISVTSSIATPQTEVVDKGAGDAPKRSLRRPSEAELGLKVPF